PRSSPREFFASRKAVLRYSLAPLAFDRRPMIEWRSPCAGGPFFPGETARHSQVYDWFSKQRGRDRLINWLGLDAWIDSTLAGTWEWIKDSYDAASSFFARFQLRGWKRLLNEAASEGFSMAAGGL